MKPLCFVGVVDAGYQDYLPLFACFALQAYPDAEMIFYHAGGPLEAEVREALQALGDLGSIDARPLDYRYDPNHRQSLKSLRWVLYDEDFARYENVYIGDVDVLIVRQEPSLCAARLRHSAEIGRPYSNRVRPGLKLVAGISHFVRAQEYFPQVLPRMLQYREQIGAGTLQIHNEELLYRLLDETVGLPPEPAVALRTHHGIHLRALHTARALAVQRARTDYYFQLDFEPHVDGFLAVARSARCVDLVERLTRFDATPQRLARYPSGGPTLTQFRNVLSLCDELLAERARGTP